MRARGDAARLGERPVPVGVLGRHVRLLVCGMHAVGVAVEAVRRVLLLQQGVHVTAMRRERVHEVEWQPKLCGTNWGKVGGLPARWGGVGFGVGAGRAG